MKPIVEFCISNIANGAQDSFEKLERDPNLDVLDYGCLSYCTKCAESLYALVNGEIVEADSPEELTQKVYDFIEENPLF
jgi:uncharacterized protein YuzB (UPF0349 family)